MSVRPKKRRDSVDSQESDDSWNSDDSWEEIEKKGDVFFNYMIHKFESMFDGESIKEFNIRDEGVYDICSEELMKKYGSAMEKELILWIREQYASGRLFNKENWKPFRDVYTFSTIYLGYNLMFSYNDYYFYLAISEDYVKEENKYKDVDEDVKQIIHFQLVILYGLNDKRIKPDSRAIILPDNTVPMFYWDRK